MQTPQFCNSCMAPLCMEEFKGVSEIYCKHCTDSGGVALSLYSRNALAEDANLSPIANGFSGITLAHNAKSTEEVDEVLHKAEQSGAKILKRAQKVFWGGYSGYFADPDGHIWEVAWNPYVGFDESDALVLP